MGGKNQNLIRAKAEKNDEFYTRLEDIEKEISQYPEDTFRGKNVYCNCDSPESNFVKYFTDNYDRLGLAGFRNTWLGMGGEGNGDFRSEECIKFLDEADVVVSNPPFSLFREYVELLMQYKKKFIIIGNKNAITYKEVFKYIKANQLWIGCRNMAGGMWFYGKCVETAKPTNVKEFNGVKCANVASCWFTNIVHSKRNTPLDLVGNVYTPDKYPKYDNYDAIEVAKVSEIPEGYTGAMGVPITFLDKYCPEQFKIVKFRKGDDDKDLSVNGKCPYFRILIKAKPDKSTTGRQK